MSIVQPAGVKANESAGGAFRDMMFGKEALLTGDKFGVAYREHRVCERETASHNAGICGVKGPTCERMV